MITHTRHEHLDDAGRLLPGCTESIQSIGDAGFKLLSGRYLLMSHVPLRHLLPISSTLCFTLTSIAQQGNSCSPNSSSRNPPPGPIRSDN